jgi:hypothetical protein
MQAFAQKVVNYGISALVKASQDSSMVTLGSGERAFRSKAVEQDTILGRWVKMDGLNADMTVEFRKANQSGTDTVQFNIELFRGAGTPDSSGLSRHQLVISTSDTTMNFHISDSTWVKDRLFRMWRFQIVERDTCQNDYIVNVNQFSPLGNAGTNNILD